MHANQLPEMNAAISAVMGDPSIGASKRGDLDWLRVYKFKMVNQLALLGYTLDKSGVVVLTFVDFGSHEKIFTAI